MHTKIDFLLSSTHPWKLIKFSYNSRLQEFLQQAKVAQKFLILQNVVVTKQQQVLQTLTAEEPTNSKLSATHSLRANSRIKQECAELQNRIFRRRPQL